MRSPPFNPHVDLPNRMAHDDGWILLDAVTEEPIINSFRDTRNELRELHKKRTREKLPRTIYARARHIIVWNKPPL